MHTWGGVPSPEELKTITNSGPSISIENAAGILFIHLFQIEIYILQTIIIIEKFDLKRDNRNIYTGRLKSRYEFLKYASKANKLILNMIDFGYVAIPFVSLPGKCLLRNYASSTKRKHFVPSRNTCIVE